MQEQNPKKQSPKDFDVHIWLRLDCQQSRIDRLNERISTLDKRQNRQAVWILCLTAITLVLAIDLFFY